MLQCASQKGQLFDTNTLVQLNFQVAQDFTDTGARQLL